MPRRLRQLLPLLVAIPIAAQTLPGLRTTFDGETDFARRPPQRKRPPAEPTEAAGQVPADSKLNKQLKTLFPAATSFSPKVPNPPHFKAYGTDASGATTLLGVAFWTTELEPLERGYDGPVKMPPTGRLWEAPSR